MGICHDPVAGTLTFETEADRIAFFGIVQEAVWEAFRFGQMVGYGLHPRGPKSDPFKQMERDGRLSAHIRKIIRQDGLDEVADRLELEIAEKDTTP